MLRGSDSDTQQLSSPSYLPDQHTMAWQSATSETNVVTACTHAIQREEQATHSAWEQRMIVVGIKETTKPSELEVEQIWQRVKLLYCSMHLLKAHQPDTSTTEKVKLPCCIKTTAKSTRQQTCKMYLKDSINTNQGEAINISRIKEIYRNVKLHGSLVKADQHTVRQSLGKRFSLAGKESGVWVEEDDTGDLLCVSSSIFHTDTCWSHDVDTISLLGKRQTPGREGESIT